MTVSLGCYIEVQKKLNAQCSLLTTQKRLEDVDMNSRGLSSPRYFNVRILVASVKLRLSESRAKLAWAMPSVSNLDEVKDANRQPSPHVRVFQTPFLFLVNYSTGSRTRGYSPYGLPVFQTVFSF